MSLSLSKKNACFWYSEVLSRKMHFLKCFSFDTRLSCDNTPNKFFAILKIFFFEIFRKKLLFHFLGVYTAPIKIWFIFVENRQRNNLSDLTTSNPVFTTYPYCNGENPLLAEDPLYYLSPICIGLQRPYFL